MSKCQELHAVRARLITLTQHPITPTFGMALVWYIIRAELGHVFRSRSVVPCPPPGGWRPKFRRPDAQTRPLACGMMGSGDQVGSLCYGTRPTISWSRTLPCLCLAADGRMAISVGSILSRPMQICRFTHFAVSHTTVRTIREHSSCQADVAGWCCVSEPPP